MLQPNSSFLGIDIIDLSTDDTVNSGANDTVILQPPKGKIYRIVQLNMVLPDPAGSSSGTHSIRVHLGDGNDQDSMLFCSAASGDDVKTYFNALAGATEVPSGTDDQYYMTTSGVITASYDHPIYFYYANDTDVNQTGTRRLKIKVEIYKDLL